MPVATPGTKIEEESKALKEYTKSFETATRNETDPLKHNMETRNERFEIC